MMDLTRDITVTDLAGGHEANAFWQKAHQAAIKNGQAKLQNLMGAWAGSGPTGPSKWQGTSSHDFADLTRDITTMGLQNMMTAQEKYPGWYGLPKPKTSSMTKEERYPGWYGLPTHMDLTRDISVMGLWSIGDV